MQTKEDWIHRLKVMLGFMDSSHKDGIAITRTDIVELLSLLKTQDKRVIGRWKQLKGDFTTPGGTPYYVCGACDGSGHLHGCEYPRRKVICDTCGRINLYPWEKAYEEGSSMWESDEEAVTHDG